jgi:DNA invertase Pin-like site-specific DNA recombinase
VPAPFRAAGLDRGRQLFRPRDLGRIPSPPEIQELIADAMRGRFQVVLSEAMDRLSRDQEDIAGLFKRMAFAGVKIVTLSEGEVTSLHVGLKGTMNAIFLKDLADKVRRGLRGRVELGKAGGGNSYGFDVVKQFASDGEPVRGDRKINEAEAAIVRRIFGDYSAGKSPKKIAFELNAEGRPRVDGLQKREQRWRIRFAPSFSTASAGITRRRALRRHDAEPRLA